MADPAFPIQKLCWIIGGRVTCQCAAVYLLDTTFLLDLLAPVFGLYTLRRGSIARAIALRLMDILIEPVGYSL
jgi:hypothetical protein